MRHRLAAARVRPQALGLLAAIVGDHPVGGVEDRLGGAVVLLQLDHRRLGEVALELEDVADVGMPEAIDGLEIVADDEQVAVLLAEKLEEPVLDPVRVLVLVDEHPAEGAAVALANVLEQLQQVDRPHQQVVEVHRVGLQHPPLVQPVDVGRGALEVRALGARRTPPRRSAGSWPPRSAPARRGAESAWGRRPAPPGSA